MGVDLVAYRAAIGIFYSVTHRRMSLRKAALNLLVSVYSVFTIFVLLFVRNFVKNDDFTLYRIIILLACMDVELNPGPLPADVNSLDIFHLNTRSIRNKIDYLSDIVDSYQILCLSETHLEPNIHSDTLLFEGFDLPIRKDRTHNGGGVMIYMSNILKYTRRDDLEDPRLETIWVEVTSKYFDLLFLPQRFQYLPVSICI